jgi:hypothetical protein
MSYYTAMPASTEFFRGVDPDADLTVVSALETASYPPDEAASPERIAERAQQGERVATPCPPHAMRFAVSLVDESAFWGLAAPGCFLVAMKGTDAGDDAIVGCVLRPRRAIPLLVLSGQTLAFGTAVPCDGGCGS